MHFQLKEEQPATRAEVEVAFGEVRSVSTRPKTDDTDAGVRRGVAAVATGTVTDCFEIEFGLVHSQVELQRRSDFRTVAVGLRTVSASRRAG